jgi:hypothetical protein
VERSTDSNKDEQVSQKFTQMFSKKYNVYFDYDTNFVSKNPDSKSHVVAKNPLENP